MIDLRNVQLVLRVSDAPHIPELAGLWPGGVEIRPCSWCSSGCWVIRASDPTSNVVCSRCTSDHLLIDYARRFFANRPTEEVKTLDKT